MGRAVAQVFDQLFFEATQAGARHIRCFRRSGQKPVYRDAEQVGKPDGVFNRHGVPLHPFRDGCRRNVESGGERHHLLRSTRTDRLPETFAALVIDLLGCASSQRIIS